MRQASEMIAPCACKSPSLTVAAALRSAESILKFNVLEQSPSQARALVGTSQPRTHILVDLSLHLQLQQRERLVPLGTLDQQQEVAHALHRRAERSEGRSNHLLGTVGAAEHVEMNAIDPHGEVESIIALAHKHPLVSGSSRALGTQLIERIVVDQKGPDVGRSVGSDAIDPQQVGLDLGDRGLAGLAGCR